jgi:hypothetical protein
MARDLSTIFRVGRYTCSITLPLPLPTSGAVSIETRWEPEPPHRLNADELAEYRRGRDALLAEAAKHVGGPVAVVEV